ncbi:MAG: hypothetical protein HRT87_00355 [Legionellales bacterium]|nr:hypothetical protein [Legionellales bacterium]
MPKYNSLKQNSKDSLTVSTNIEEIQNTGLLADIDKATFISKKVISIHAPSNAKKNKKYLEKLVQKLKDGNLPLTIQGDFNIDFTNQENAQFFLELLKKNNLAIDSLRYVPYKTDKMRSRGANNAQMKKAMEPDVGLKDFSFTIKQASENNFQCSQKLLNLGNTVTEIKKFPLEVHTDHAFSYSLEDDSLVISLNVIATKINENKLYPPNKYDEVLEVTTNLQDQQLKIMAKLLGIEVEENINYGKDYKAKKVLFKEIDAKWPQAKNEHKNIIEQYIKQTFKSKYFADYNRMLNEPKNQKEIERLIEENLKTFGQGNNLQVLSNSERGAEKLMNTFLWMGIPNDPNADILKIYNTDHCHDYFGHQVNGGFPKYEEDTQYEIEMAQAREFLEQLQALSPEYHKKIKAIDLIEVEGIGPDKSHSEVLVNCIDEIMHQSTLKDVNEINFDDVLKKAAPYQVIASKFKKYRNFNEYYQKQRLAKTNRSSFMGKMKAGLQEKGIHSGRSSHKDMAQVAENLLKDFLDNPTEDKGKHLCASISTMINKIDGESSGKNKFKLGKSSLKEILVEMQETINGVLTDNTLTNAKSYDNR